MGCEYCGVFGDVHAVECPSRPPGFILVRSIPPPINDPFKCPDRYHLRCDACGEDFETWLREKVICPECKQEGDVNKPPPTVLVDPAPTSCVLFKCGRCRMSFWDASGQDTPPCPYCDSNQRDVELRELAALINREYPDIGKKVRIVKHGNDVMHLRMEGALLSLATFPAGLNLARFLKRALERYLS